MKLTVDYRELRDNTAGLLRRLEEGETIVITRQGKPVADLISHQADASRWMTPSDVLAIRELASADPTWPADLAKLRAECTEDRGPI